MSKEKQPIDASAGPPDWVRGVALVLCVCGSLSSRSGLASSPSPVRPNILVILADDLGYGDVQCLNPRQGRIPTPHLDRLAAQGMTFVDAHSGSAVCTPTRYGLLTGRYCWRTRLQSGVLDGGDDEPLIAANRLTVAELLRRAGYQTAAIGKWHLGFQSESSGQSESAPGERDTKAGKGGLETGTRIIGGPTTRGFDYFFGFSNARTMAALIENDRVIERIEPIEMLPRLAQRAAQYIGQVAADARDGKPFFLYFALSSPHTPIVPAPQWQGKSGISPYADFVMQTDAAAGTALAALEEQGLVDQTLVIFSSDNGCSPAAKVEQLEQQGHYPSAGFRGYKADIWEGGHRVPFLARWPGRVRPGTTSDQIVCLGDLMATCAEIVGTKLAANAGEDSVSFLPALLGTARRPLREAIVHHSINGKFAIRQGRWKLVLCAGSGGWGKPGDLEAVQNGAPTAQLYDMSEDSAETRNLQAERPEVVQQLRQLLERYIADGRSTLGAAQRNDVDVDLLKQTVPKESRANTKKRKKAK